MVKNGKTKSGKQRYICSSCKRTQVESYTYQAYHPNINQQIITLTKEGLGIKSTARVLYISTTTLLKRIIAIVQNGVVLKTLHFAEAEHIFTDGLKNYKYLS